MTAAPEPVSDEVIDDLQQRLRSTRRVPLPPGVGWNRGTDADYLADLVTYWADGYDWRPHEARIRALPWVGVEADGYPMRAIHQRASSDDATAVVLLHGWPDSVLRFERVLPLLTDVQVVVPALPGYPFAPGRPEVGMSTSRMGELVPALMAELGYERYVVSGGDIGARVAHHLAARHPDQVSALHLTDITSSAGAPEGLSAQEQEFLDGVRQWRLTEGAYLLEQATKPHTLAVGLGDSPAGTAAWILEKLRSWSHSDGDVESVFARDDLLTWITAYWVTGSIGTSFSPYTEPREPVGFVSVPTAVQIFPHDLIQAPREFAERFFDVRVWDVPTDGGHFGAWERPEVFVAGLRRAIALAG